MKAEADPKVVELAEYFLADVPPEAKSENTLKELAEHIQDAVERFLEFDLGAAMDAAAASEGAKSNP